MKLTNFTLQAGFTIHVPGWELDLHNSYDLVACDHDVDSCQVKIEWQRTTGTWVNPHHPTSIRLVFTDVSKFETKNGDPTMAMDRQTISFIGYLHPEDNTMDGYLDNMTDPTQDLIIGLEDESAIKIHARTVKVEVDA